MKKFSKIEIAVIKRTAQNVASYVAKKESINNKIAALKKELENEVQPLIDVFQGPIKEMTGGYTTEDLVIKEAVKTGKMDPKTGKETISYRYALKYPETVIPVTPSNPVEDMDAQEDAAWEQRIESGELQAAMPSAGNDYDIDSATVQQEAEHDDDPWG